MAKIKTTHGGHWGLNMMDPGATWKKFIEAVIAYNISKLISKLTGAKEVSDRKGSNVNNNLYNLVNNMNAVSMGDNDFHISNHLNAFNHSANGVEVWYYAGDAKGAEMARKTSAAIAKALGIVDRGAKPTVDLCVVANSYGHTLLVEWCFIDVENDVTTLLNNLDKAVNAMVGCFDYKIEESGGKEVTKKPEYWDKTGKYKMLKDDTFYCEKELKKRSSWAMKKDSVFFVDEVVTVGKMKRGAVMLGKTKRYITLNKSIVKKV